MSEPNSSAPRSWSIRITAVLMVVYWVTVMVLNGVWLSASLEQCGPDSAPECGMFDGMYQLGFGFTFVLGVAGLVALLGVWGNRFGGHVAALCLHLVGFCALGISGDLVGSKPVVTTWTVVLIATNLAILVLLLSHLFTPRMPQRPEEHPR